MSFKFRKDDKSELLHMKKALTNTLKRKENGKTKRRKIRRK